MWGAVLALAYEDALGNLMLRLPRKVSERKYYLDRRNLIIEDARSWFNSTRQDTTSFNWVCSVLDIDPGRVRDYINTLEPIQAKLPKTHKKGRPRKHRT